MSDELSDAVPKPGKDRDTEPKTRNRDGHNATIYDVARVAGVNASTVSRTLNGQKKAGQATEARILAAVEQLGYRSNPVARALPTGRTNTLGLVIADLTNPMFFEVLRGAERTAVARGYTLVIADSTESERIEASAVERVVSFVDGLILVTTRLQDEQVVALAKRKPVMILNRDVPGVPSLVPDIAPGIAAAVDHLYELGHRSVAYLAGRIKSWMNHARWTQILAQATARGMSIVEIISNGHDQEAGRESLTRVRAAGVTAVIAYNDLVAIGLLRAAQAEHLDVPRELSIIGFDDIFGADFTHPPMTTIKVPLMRMGQIAVAQALDLLDVPPSPQEQAPSCEALITSLIIRGSTAKPGGNGPYALPARTVRKKIS